LKFLPAKSDNFLCALFRLIIQSTYMKRISRIILVTMFSLLVLGGTRAFAGSGGGGNNQGQNNQGQNNNQGKDGGLISWIDNLLNDIFGGGNNQGSNQGDGGSWAGNPGGGTAPIDGGISLLLAAGVGLGVKKIMRARRI
jgi:hypothetical protein